MVRRQPTKEEEGIRMHATLSPETYWSRHAEAWGNLADVQYETGDVDREDFYDELVEAANYLTEVHFN